MFFKFMSKFEIPTVIVEGNPKLQQERLEPEYFTELLAKRMAK